MTPITGQTAVDVEEKDAARHPRSSRRWPAAADVEEQRPLLQDIFKAAVDGDHDMSKEK